MAEPKKIVDAINDPNGNVSAVKLKGNKTFTPIETAIKMAEQGIIDAVPVRPKNRKPYLRSKPDRKQKNNLDYLAEH